VAAVDLPAGTVRRYLPLPIASAGLPALLAAPDGERRFLALWSTPRPDDPAP
jgi:hypothetical protein